ncbi:hypothetical protein [Streptomyces mesophilus]
MAELVRRSGELALLTHGTRLGGGKWLARRLEPSHRTWPRVWTRRRKLP